MNIKVLIALSVLGLASAAVYNAPCKEDSTCHHLYTTWYQCEDLKCIRKKFDFDSRDILGFISIVFIASVANAGGLGAGAVIIPVYMFVYNFVATDSVPMSKITIFAGAVVNFFMSWNDRHPKNHNRFQINYNMAAVIVPLLLAGTQVGVYLTKLVPPALITFSLTLYLMYSVVKMYQK
jgi:uncharacterized membrane protein YfcA